MMMMMMTMMTIAAAVAAVVAETVTSVASLTASSSKGSSKGWIVVSSEKVESNLIPNNYNGWDQTFYRNIHDVFVLRDPLNRIYLLLLAVKILSQSLIFPTNVKHSNTLDLIPRKHIESRLDIDLDHLQ